MLTLSTLFDKVVSQGPTVVKPSRVAPLKTAVKQYAAMLGTSPEHCRPEHYHLPSQERNSLIETHTDLKLSVHAVRNLKDNIHFLLQLGEKLQLLQPLKHSEPEKSWHETYRLSRENIKRGALILHVWPRRQPYCLGRLPARLAAEVQAYDEWSTKPFVPGRPARLKKRRVTTDNRSN